MISLELLPTHPSFLERPRGRYVSKLPRRRNSKISRAIQAAVHEQRRILRRQEQVKKLREIDQQQNQQERQAAVQAAIEEAERILQAILAKRASEEAAAHPEEKSNTDTSQDHNQDLRPIS